MNIVSIKKPEIVSTNETTVYNLLNVKNSQKKRTYGMSTLNNSMKIRSTNKRFCKGPILVSEIITKINIKYI